MFSTSYISPSPSLKFAPALLSHYLLPKPTWQSTMMERRNPRFVGSHFILHTFLPSFYRIFKSPIVTADTLTQIYKQGVSLECLCLQKCGIRSYPSCVLRIYCHNFKHTESFQTISSYFYLMSRKVLEISKNTSKCNKIDFFLINLD